MKVGLIYVPCGLGDILFSQKIAHHIKSLGYEVYWPVLPQFNWLNDYIKDLLLYLILKENIFHIMD